MTTTEELEGRIRKIRGLLALGSSSNEAEAAAAVSKAQQLMLQWGIEESIIAATTKPVVEKHEVSDLQSLRKTFTAWERVVVAAVAKTSYCDLLLRHEVHPNYEEHDIVVLFGRKTDTTMAEYALAFLHSTLKLLAEQHVRSRMRQGLKGRGLKDARESWLIGAAEGVRAMLWEEYHRRNKATEGGSALVVSRDAELNEFKSTFGLTTMSAAKSTVRDREAFANGHATGKALSVRPGVHGSAPTASINA